MSEPLKHLRVLPCLVGGQRCSVDMSGLVRIERSHQLQLSPAEEGPIGWCLAEAGDFPVYSLAATLGATWSPPGLGGRILVAEDASSTWGFLVDGVLGIVDVAAKNVLSLPALVGRQTLDLLRGVVDSGDELWPLLAPWVLRQQRVAAAAAGPVEEAATVQLDPRCAPAAPRVAAAGDDAGERRSLFFETQDSRERTPSMVFALSMSQVLEVMPMSPLCAVPFAPDYVRGLMRWHAQAIAVVDLDRFLGLATGDRARADERVIVARVGGGTVVALTASSDLRGVSLPVEHRPVAAPEQLDVQRTLGVFEHRGGTLVVPDLAGLATASV